MEKLIYNVRQIFGEYLTSKGCSFYNIPEYQRGINGLQPMSYNYLKT